MIKALSFLNLLDQSNKMSITNLAMYLILIKIMISPFEWASAVSLFVVALNYTHKRKTISEATKAELDVTAKIEQALSSTTSQLKEIHTKIIDQAISVDSRIQEALSVTKNELNEMQSKINAVFLRSK